MKWLILKILILLSVPFLLLGAFVMLSLRDMKLQELLALIPKKVFSPPSRDSIEPMEISSFTR